MNLRLDGVIDAGDRQVTAQEIIGLGDHAEIDDEARGLGRMFGEEMRNLAVRGDDPIDVGEVVLTLTDESFLLIQICSVSCRKVQPRGPVFAGRPYQ